MEWLGGGVATVRTGPRRALGGVGGGGGTTTLYQSRNCTRLLHTCIAKDIHIVCTQDQNPPFNRQMAYRFDEENIHWAIGV